MNGLISHNWLRYEPWAFRLVLLLLLVLLAEAGARLTWALFTPPPAIGIEAPRAAAAPAAPTSPTASTTAAQRLFGNSAAQTPTATSAPETKLDLKLVGVFATGDSSALAIITSGRQPEALYAIGDALPGGATLRAVHPDRVILERNGALETLRLPRESLGSGVVPAGRSAGAAPPGRGDLGQQLRDYRREAMRNPARMAEYVDAQPVQQGGEFIGYRLTLRQDLPLFNELGFRPGDVVTEVNGVPLDRPEAGIRALRQLATARELNVTVLRNGSPQTIRADFGR